MRKELRRWLRRLHDELHVTSIFVTHDQEEALEVADQIVVMNHGKVEQVGAPNEVYQHPATPFVYGFLGNVNLFHGRIHGIGPLAQLELVREDNGQIVEAMISTERAVHLNLQIGEALVVKPKLLHVFVDNVNA